jgi:predicted amidohydrolase YtcJ
VRHRSTGSLRTADDIANNTANSDVVAPTTSRNAMCHACDRTYLESLRALSRRNFLGMAGMGAALAGLGGCKALTRSSDSKANQVFVARRIHTLNPDAPTVEAIATSGGRIVALGCRADVLARYGRTSEVHDFGDRTVLPGFVDPHMHSNFSGLRPWLDISPFTTQDLDEARAKLVEAAQKVAPGGWLQAKMLDPSLQSGRPFSRADLDELVGDVPVFILESNGHLAYGNTRAFELAGVTRDTPDPPQGRFTRDARGELTGRLEEPPAFQPFVDVMPAPSSDELVGLIREDLQDGARRGCTTLHDCGIGGLFAEDDLALLDAAVKDDAPVRYAGMLVSTHFARWEEMGLRPGQRSDFFHITGIKAWADGSNQGRTGYLREPYLDTDERGALNYTPEEILEVVGQAHRSGWQVGVHANGDAAIDVVLDAFEKVLAAAPREDHRHRIEHASLLRPEHIERMAKLGVSPSFLIGHVHYWGKAFRDRLFGPQRAEFLDPCASALAAGLRISLHSDYNVTPIDPLRCIQNAVVRDMRDGGETLAPHERISVHQGIRSMTIDAAWQCQLDHECGSLEVGKSADLVVLGADPYEVEHRALQDIAIESTWLAGRRTHGS